jgi:hypothetical protein
MQLTEEDIESTKTEILALLRRVKRRGIGDVIRYLEISGFFTAPCSTKYHLNVPGGLANHSLRVYDILRTIVSAQKLNIPHDSIAIMGLLHDISKAGLYKANITKSGSVHKGQPWKIEESLVMDHGSKSTYLLAIYGLELTDFEAESINYHMGPFGKGFWEKQYLLHPLTQLLFCADMAATQIEEAME